jgi:general secretion pathway protein K
MRSRSNLPHAQRGVALIIALVLFALAAILAVRLGHSSFLERRRAVGLLSADQAFQFGMGGEALAADVLNQDDPNQDTPNDSWAKEQPPIPLQPPGDNEAPPIGEIAGRIEDMQGRFNLNSLVSRKQDGSYDDQPLHQFQRLLVSLKLESKWAALVRDWIDPDDNPFFPDGAEDAVYTSLTPPYRAGNWPMLSTSELLALPGFGAERYRRIEPFVAALPVGTKINLCTASGEVLDSFGDNVSDFADLEQLQKNRKNGCFPDVNGLQAYVKPDEYTAAKPYVDAKSQFFRLTTVITLGTSEFTLYSLLKRDPGHVTPLQRSFGTT